VTHIANNLDNASDVLILQSGDDLHYATALHFQRTGSWPLFILFRRKAPSRQLAASAARRGHFHREIHA
jgi:hypothetical protein